MDRVSDKKTIGEKFGDKKLMDRKTNANVKFKNVTKTLDTGKTVNDVQVLSDKFVSKRKGELFRRIKNSTVAKMIDECNNVESIYNLVDEAGNDAIFSDGQSSVAIPETESVYSHQTSNSAKTSVTAVTYATEMLGNLTLLSYMMLDLREKSDYDNFHIKEAYSFPGPNISRDKFPQEIFGFKNKDDKLIIVYGSDEKNGITYAQLLTQKGFDNIFLLSGGIEEFVKSYPEKCDGTMVQQLINAKLQEEIMKRDAMMKKTQMSSIKSRVGNTGGISDTTSVLNAKSVSSKQSGVSSRTKDSISNLKKDLKK